MSLVDEITQAIGAHGVWKARLSIAIAAGESTYTVEVLRTDDACAFGRWLKALPVSNRTVPHFDLVHSLHARFHLEAAAVLALALKGRKAEATHALTNGKYRDLSLALTAAMMEWKASLA